jgi:hypothetical protein
MASAKPPFAEQENLSAIYPVHNVRNLSGSDRFAAPPTLCPEFLAKYPDGRLFAAAARRRI